MNKRRKRAIENLVLRQLIKCAAIVAVFMICLLLFMLLIWWRGQQAAPQRETEAAEPLVIEIPEPATEGSVTVYTPDGAVYGYFGEIEIISDGRDGSQIDIELNGWLVGELHEDAESEAGNE